MDERASASKSDKYSRLLKTFPERPLTEEEVSEAITRLYRRDKQWAEDHPDHPLASPTLKLYFPTEPTEEERRDYPEVVEMIETGTQEVRTIVAENLRRKFKQPVEEQYQFRKRFESGEITESDIDKLLDFAKKLANAARETGELPLAFGEESENIEEKLFKKGIVHIYSVFDGNIEQVGRVIELASSTALYSINDTRPTLSVFRMLTKACEIYEQDKNSYAVENYFNQLRGTSNSL